ncbi:unnamed protein product, partial [Staurois parvus]
LTSLAVFPSVARGKVSVPKAVTLSYTRAHHVALQSLPCPTLSRCVPCSVPGHLLRLMPASGFCVPVPASGGTYGGRNRREIQKCKNVTFTKYTKI